MRRFVRFFQASVQDGANAVLLFSERLADAYIVLFSGALALALTSMAETLGASMASLTDTLGSSIDGVTDAIANGVSEVANVATTPVVRVGSVVLSLMVGLRLSLRHVRNSRVELTPLRLLFLGLVLDLLISYPVNKLWDLVWGKLFP